MQNEDLLVATVLKPQGIKGEIKVKVYCDSADDLVELSKVYIDGAEYKMLKCRAEVDTAYLTLRGVADRNTAELLRGKDVFAKREDMPQLPEGRYYIVDLISCRVETENGEYIGDITGVTPAKTDIYSIKTAKGETMFAAAEGVILSVDTKNKVIVVNKKAFEQVVV